MIEQNILNTLVVNSSFQKAANEVAQFITKIYNEFEVLNNDLLTQEKKINYFSFLIDEISVLRVSHGLRPEGIFAFFNYLLKHKVEDNELVPHLQGVLIDKIILAPASKSACC